MLCLPHAMFLRHRPSNSEFSAYAATRPCHVNGAKAKPEMDKCLSHEYLNETLLYKYK